MKAYTTIILAVLSPILLCACASYNKRPWSTVICAEGKTYVLQGTETDKTASLLTVDGTFRRFTFSVCREFVLYDRANSRTYLGKYKQASDECDYATYDYFPGEGALVATYDTWKPSIANLTKQTSFRVKGLQVNLRQRQCKFALTLDSDTKQMFLYDRITGAVSSITRGALGFIGDTWHTDLFVMEEGRCLAKVVYDYSARQFVVSTWDLVADAPGPASPCISFGEYHEPLVFFVSRQGSGLIFFFGAPKDKEGATGYTLNQGIFANGRLMLRPVYASEYLAIGGRVTVESNDDRSVVVVHHLFDGYNLPNNRWTIAVLDILDGNTLKSETFAVP